MDQSKAYLLPPPLLMERAEMPPVIDPGLEGVPAYQRPLPEFTEPFASHRVEAALSSQLMSTARTTVLAHPGVEKSLGGERFEWIGVSVIDEKAAADRAEGSALRAVLYSYGENRAIEVRLDASGQEIRAVERHAYQPPATPAEIDRAVEMARTDDRHAASITEDMVGTAILVSPTDEHADAFNHRQFDVRFTRPCQRLPQHAALVDLSREVVVSVGSCCSGHLAGSAEVAS